MKTVVNFVKVALLALVLAVAASGPLTPDADAAALICADGGFICWAYTGADGGPVFVAGRFVAILL